MCLHKNNTIKCKSCKINDLQLYKNLINNNCIYYCNLSSIIHARAKRNYLISLL